MNDLKEVVRKFILDTFPLARNKNIGYEESLLETGIIDSLGILEIVNFLIEELDVDIEEDDLIPDNFNTVFSMVHFIERKNEIA